MKKQESMEVRYVEIDEAREGQRLDNFLLGQLKGVPKSHVYRLLRRGEVRVNRGRVKPDYRLQAGDSVRIPPVRQVVKVQPDGDGFEWLLQRVLHEDADLLVLDKPAGLAVHGGSGVQIGLIEALRGLRPDVPMLELVHRLDRDTSGCLLLAKHRQALLAMHEALREGRMEKQYLALVQGRWRGGPRTIQAALARDQMSSGGERRVGVSEDGREAESLFTPKGFYGSATLMEVTLVTGRTHQARVHAVHAGHPIAGDDKYGERDFNRAVRKVGLKRLFLHAARVRFIHPTKEVTIDIEAPLPTELSQVLERLRDTSSL
ncbi:MAG: 23S rRNA pseudouridine(955/2504/2580) synthase RluC [Gammaproteobacteria bacterium]|nr:23S rRNA pseudouridine(955/2504/2580) synthase RluC [Gammaproteobacteria bacterium]